jgi:branched-chain amino acid aminotransferase
VLYGLSVYTVFPVVLFDGKPHAFRLPEHFERLCNSAKLMGIDTFAAAWTYEQFVAAVYDLIAANTFDETVFVRATVHVDPLVPGTRSRGLSTTLSMFIYEAQPIVPQDGARLKTSVWRRVADFAIPARAKVNGAYVNSVLAKQDALDSGYDDCIFLDGAGHVCELSAANIFMVRDGVLITPGRESDILEGINRRTVLELAREMGIATEERAIDLTELYIADEVFACGTSAFVAPVIEIDRRMIGEGAQGALTERVRVAYQAMMRGEARHLAYFVAV